MATTPIHIFPALSSPSRTTKERPILLLSQTPLFLIHPTVRTRTRTNSSLFSANNNGPEIECPVPHEQQPINEYHSLSKSFPFSQAAGDVVEYASCLFMTGDSFALLLGLPVAWSGSAGAQAEPVKRLLCAASSGLFAVTLAVVRMYLGWAYVGNRLLSATVECIKKILLKIQQSAV